MYDGRWKPGMRKNNNGMMEGTVVFDKEESAGKRRISKGLV